MKVPGVLFLCFIFFASISLKAQQWTLQSCVDTAIKNNLSILLSNDALLVEDVNVLQSRLNQFPNLNASASQNFSFGRSLDPSTYQFNNRSAAYNNFSLNSSVILYNGGQLKNSIKQNEINKSVAMFDLEKVKSDIALSVINDFIQILYADESVNNAKLQLQSTRELMQKTALLVQGGKKAESDLAQLRAQTATEQYNLSEAEGQLRSYKLNLQQLMEMPYKENFEIIIPELPEIESLYMPESNQVYALALQTQPVIRSSELKVIAEQIALKITQGALLPRLSLNAGIGSSYSSSQSLTKMYSTTELETVGYLNGNTNQEVVNYVQHNTYTSQKFPFFNQVQQNFNQSVSLNLSVPIFNSKQVRNNIRKQQIAIHQAELNDRITKNSLRKNVEQAMVDARNAQMSYLSAKEAVSAETISYQNQQYLFDASKATAIDLLVEKNKLAVAASQLIQAKYNWVLKLKVLDYYQGKSIY